MLKQRIITAIILIPLFLWGLIKCSPQTFAMVTTAVIVWGGWEWSALIGIKKFLPSLIYPFIIFVLLIASFWLFIPYALIAALVFWLLAAILVMNYPRFSEGWGNGVLIRGLMGVLVLIPSWLAFNYIRNKEHGVFLLLFLLLLVWGADSGAYFAGKKWGKTKLAPKVSPGKSWQGLAGAFFVTLLTTVIFLIWTGASRVIWLWILPLAMITVIFSILGDLFESMLKRRENLKDSGRILPGHGGVLDRIDSLTAATPIFALGMWLFEKVLS